MEFLILAAVIALILIMWVSVKPARPGDDKVDQGESSKTDRDAG